MKIPASLLALVVAAPLVACSGAVQDPEPVPEQVTNVAVAEPGSPGTPATTTTATPKATTPPSTTPDPDPNPTADAGTPPVTPEDPCPPCGMG